MTSSFHLIRRLESAVDMRVMKQATPQV